MIVVNGTQLCKGLITRFRKTITNTEKSVIDFFIVCRRFFELINYMEIDENRAYTLTKYINKVGEKKLKKRDHNVMIIEIKTNWTTLASEENKREEIYNYKNKEDFENFRNVTEHNEELLKLFDDTT